MAKGKKVTWRTSFMRIVMVPSATKKVRTAVNTMSRLTASSDDKASPSFSTPAPAIVRSRDGEIEIELKQPLRAVTPGQAAVIYDGDRVLGGGVIARTEVPARERNQAAGILPSNVSIV